MKNCSECGKEISLNVKFCPNCGNPINMHTYDKYLNLYQNNNLKSILKIIWAISVLLLVIIAATFAYFNATSGLNCKYNVND